MKAVPWIKGIFKSIKGIFKSIGGPSRMSILYCAAVHCLVAVTAHVVVGTAVMVGGCGSTMESWRKVGGGGGVPRAYAEAPRGATGDWPHSAEPGAQPAAAGPLATGHRPLATIGYGSDPTLTLTRP